MRRNPDNSNARWQEQVLAKAIGLEHDYERLAQHVIRGQRDRPDNPDEHHLAESVQKVLTRFLEAARSMADLRRTFRFRPVRRLAATASGAAIDAAFVNLHAAEVVLVDLYTAADITARTPGVLARLRVCLPAADERLVRAEAMFGAGDPPQPGPPPTTATQPGPTAPAGTSARTATEPLAVRRAAFREAMQVSYEAADELHARARSFRNVLIIATVVLTLLIAGVCLVGVAAPKAIPLCFNPTSGTSAVPPPTGQGFVCPSSTGPSEPNRLDVTIVAVMGLLGGALSAAFTIQRLRGTSTPYGIPIALSIHKLPAGALTAIIGLILVHGEFIPGLSELDSQGQILAYAILLGFAQHLATRFIDQKAEDVLNSVPSKSSTITRRQPPEDSPANT